MKWKSSKEVLEQDAIYSALKAGVRLSSDETTKSFSIGVTKGDPKLAQKIAQVYMDAFMSKMYEDLLLELKAGKDAYVNFIEDEKEREAKKNDIYGLYEDEKLSKNIAAKLNKDQKVALKNRERKLIEEIKSEQESLKAETQNQLATQVRLETELRELLTRLGEKHPNVIQKKRRSSFC